MNRFSLFAVGVLAAGWVGLGAAAPASAGTFAPVSMSAFQAAVARNQPIVMHVRTQNGALCKAQHAVLEKLMQEPEYKDYLVLEADYTGNPQAVKMLNVTLPATLVFFRGATEVGRITGVTEEAGIVALLSKVAP